MADFADETSDPRRRRLSVCLSVLVRSTEGEQAFVRTIGMHAPPQRDMKIQETRKSDDWESYLRLHVHEVFYDIDENLYVAKTAVCVASKRVFGEPSDLYSTRGVPYDNLTYEDCVAFLAKHGFRREGT